MPCTDLLLYFSLLPGLKISDKIGPRGCIIVSLLCQYISYALLVIIPNYYLVLFSMCLFGIGSGLCQLVYQKNCWKYFPESKGLVNGIILGGCGISASILTVIADFFIINPDKIPTDDRGLYPDEIANRLINYLYFLCLYFVVLGILASVFTYKYEKEEGYIIAGLMKAEESQEIPETPEAPETKDQPPTKNNKENDEHEEVSKSEGAFRDAFFSSKNLKMLSFCFCGFCKK